MERSHQGCVKDTTTASGVFEVDITGSWESILGEVSVFLQVSLSLAILHVHVSYCQNSTVYLLDSLTI